MAQVVDRTKRNVEKEEHFLAALASGASTYKASRAAGIARSTAYEWRKEDQDFASRWDEAVDCGTDSMEDEAHRRAVHGVTRPVFYQGRECGYLQEYSDTLMIFKLKARRPEKYRETVDHNVRGNISINVLTYAPQIEGEAEEVKVIE